MDRDGRAQAVVVISPIRRWWTWWLRLTWPLAEPNPLVKRPLVRLAFIHVAHWSLLTRVPARGGRRLRFPYIIFHSNYNDDLAAYIDAFALIVPWRMRLMWHGIYGFPGPRAVDRFLAFVQSRATPVQHYFCAYPDGSAREIAAALSLSTRHERFAERAAGLRGAAFTHAWEEFLGENERLL